MNNDLETRAKTYPNFRQCSIQTFNDQNKEEHSQSRILPMTRENLEKCEKLQKMLPYGIYFSVNPMESWKRNRESVKFIQTWICDIDDMDKEKQLNLIKNAKLKPSLVVESVHGFHLYYLADKELSELEFENWNRWLKNYFGGDPKVCKDTARVLRIPWFYHMKGNPIMEKFREDLSWYELYSVEQMQEAFPNQSDTTPWRIKQREQLNTLLNDNDSFWRRAWELDSKMMLEEFSWSRWLSWDQITFKRNSWGTEQIYVNGKSTWCWIDKNGLIWSWDKGWPTRIQWLKRYGLVDRKELAKELKNRHPEIEEKKVVKISTQDFIYKPTEVPTLRKPDFTWGNKELDDHLWKPSKWQLIILLGETWAWKTTFATFMARQNKWCCYYVLEDSVENIARRYALKRAWITKAEFNEWMWSDEKEEAFRKAYLNFKNRDLTLVDIWHKISVETLLESMKEMKANGCNLFFVDNLWFVVWNGDNEATQTADVSSKLISFCLDENVCVILLHHFKKRWKVTDQRDIGQMRWSWKLWDDAFMVVEYIRDLDQTFLKVYKDRNRWDIGQYEIEYNMGEFLFKGVYI